MADAETRSEKLGGGKSPASPAEKRTLDLANKAGEAAWARAQELLERHADILDSDMIEEIKRREFETAVETAKAARAEGRMNNNSNNMPGITLFVSQEGFEGLSEAADKEDASDYFADYVGQMEPVDPDGTMHSLRLPQGTYIMGFGGASFYGEVEMEEGQQASRENPFSMPYEGIVRIEGDGGEMWQNVNFQPDGMPRERQ